jgi:hypothetical protein
MIKARRKKCGESLFSGSKIHDERWRLWEANQMQSPGWDQEDTVSMMSTGLGWGRAAGNESVKRKKWAVDQQAPGSRTIDEETTKFSTPYE